MSISAIITAAGKSSRMYKDQVAKNIKIKNKLLLNFNNSTVIETTIKNVLFLNIDECIIVLGHYADQIKKVIYNNFKDKVKLVFNDPIDVGLSNSLYNGLVNTKSKYVLCITADQPTITTKTFNNIIKTLLNSQNPEKTISILRRLKTGKLNTTKGLGMPFAANRKNLIKYLQNKNDNLNPILRKMFQDGYNFYAIKEKHKKELININYYNDYLKILK